MLFLLILQFSIIVKGMPVFMAGYRYSMCVRNVTVEKLLAKMLPNTGVGKTHACQIRYMDFQSHNFQQLIQFIHTDLLKKQLSFSVGIDLLVIVAR